MPYAAASFGDGASETLGAVTGTSTGTLVTASATVNAKGAWETIGTSTFAYERIIVQVGATGSAADYVFDIGIDDGAGNSFVLAENLRISALKGAGDLFLSYSLPLKIAAGAIVEARSAATVASAGLRMTIVGCSASPLSGGSYSYMVALYTPATSRGVAIDAGATRNAKGAWAQLQASTAHNVDAIMLGIGPNADVTRTAVTTGLLDIGIGTAGAEFSLASNMLWGFTTTSDTPFPNVIGVIPMGIAAGTRVAARCQANNNTAGDRTLDLAAWGFVA